jgi:thimet oligopeptidase
VLGAGGSGTFLGYGFAARDYARAVLEVAAAPITAEQLEERDRDRLARASTLLRHLESDRPTSHSGVLSMLNDMHIELNNLVSECGICISMHPDKEVRDTAERLQREASEFAQVALQSQPLYDALGAMDKTKLDADERRLVELVRQDMRRAGVELGPAEREKARALRAELTKLSQDHARNIRDDTRYIALESSAELAGLPPDYVASHLSGPDGVIRISTNPPDSTPFLTYAHSERARKALFMASSDRAPANLGVLRDLVRIRHELATLLGYSSWAHYNLEERMVGTPERAERFLREVDDATIGAARAEYAELLAEKRTDRPEATTLARWDWAYYENRVKTKRFHFDGQELRPYLEYRHVRQAILGLNAELFGFGFSRVVHEERWHPSVESFDITIDGVSAGRISLDMHPREGKNKWFFSQPLVLGVRDKQAPHGVLCCNFADPAEVSGPALMEHEQVVIYFHEFGHLVHALARGGVRFVRLSRSEGDFMEAPSIFLEDFIYDHVVLARFGKHVDSGAPLPAELVERLREARDFGQGLLVREFLLFLAHLALSLHDGTRVGADSRALAAEAERRYSLFEPMEVTNFPASWEHMGNEMYSAAYYTYAWSMVIAKDLRTAFGGNLLDTAVARRYRDQILAPGGTKPAAELVREFLGRPYDMRAFKAWLSPDRTNVKPA